MEEVDQQNATCLIVKAAEGVDDALEHIQKTNLNQKLRVCMPTPVWVQLAILPTLTVNTLQSGIIESRICIFICS